MGTPGPSTRPEQAGELAEFKKGRDGARHSLSGRKRHPLSSTTTSDAQVAPSGEHRMVSYEAEGQDILAPPTSQRIQVATSLLNQSEQAINTIGVQPAMRIHNLTWIALRLRNDALVGIVFIVSVKR